MTQERINGNNVEKDLSHIPVLFRKDVHPASIEGPAVVVRTEHEFTPPVGITRQEYYGLIRDKLQEQGKKEADELFGFTGEKTHLITKWQESAERVIGLAEFAQRKFTEAGDEFRKDGKNETITHSLWIAYSLMELGVYDMDAIEAVILHDLVEDTDVTLEQIEKMTNDRVRSYVKSLTKVKSDEVEDLFQPEDGDLEEAAAKETGKRLVEGALQHSVVVSAIKGLDALHNHLTDQALPEGRREERRELTDVFYRPWVHAIGFQKIENLLGEQVVRGDKPGSYSWIKEFQNDIKKDELTDALVGIGKEWMGAMSEEMERYGLEQPYVEINFPDVYEAYKRSRKGAIFEEYVLPRMKIVCEDELHLRQCNGAVSRLNKELSRNDELFEQDLENHGSIVRQINVDVNGSSYEIEVEFTTTQEEIQPADLVLHPDMKQRYKDIADDKLTLTRRGYGDIVDDENFMVRMTELAGRQVLYHDFEGNPHVGPADITAWDAAFRLGPGLAKATKEIKVNGISVPLNTKLRNGDQIEVVTSDNGEQITRAANYDMVTTDYAISQIHKSLKRQEESLSQDELDDHNKRHDELRGRRALEMLYGEIRGKKLNILFKYSPIRGQLTKKYSKATQDEEEPTIDNFYRKVGQLPISLLDDEIQDGDYHTTLPERWRELADGDNKYPTKEEVETAKDALVFVDSLIEFRRNAPTIWLLLKNIPGRLKTIGEITSKAGGDVQPMRVDALNSADIGFDDVLAVEILFLESRDGTIMEVINNLFREFEEARVYKLDASLDYRPPLKDLEEYQRPDHQQISRSRKQDTFATHGFE